MEKKCIICGNTFTPRNKCQLCCSPECSAENQRIKKKERRRKVKSQKKCVICGKSFVPKNKNQICCSPECSAENKKRKKRKYPDGKRCRICGKSFSGSKLYCSNKCTQIANYRIRQLRMFGETPTVANMCPKDCTYMSKHGIESCNYILITGTPRGGDVTTCNVYLPGRKKNRGWKSSYTKDFYEEF